MNLSLTPEIEQRIADQLNQGHYQSAHEVILAALELLDQRQQYLTELRQEIAIDATQIEQGQVINGEQVWLISSTVYIIFSRPDSIDIAQTVNG